MNNSHALSRLRASQSARARRRGSVQLLVALTLGLIGLGGGVGVGMVWARQKIALAANHTRQIEQRIVQADRRLAELSTQITAEQSMDMLNRRNTEWRLGLVPPREPQLVRVAAGSIGPRSLTSRDTGRYADRALTPSALPTVRLTLAARAR